MLNVPPKNLCKKRAQVFIKFAKKLVWSWIILTNPETILIYPPKLLKPNILHQYSSVVIKTYMSFSTSISFKGYRSLTSGQRILDHLQTLKKHKKYQERIFHSF